MGGKLAVVARYGDMKTICFKVHTYFFNNTLNTPLIMNELWLKNLIVEYNLLKDEKLAEQESADYDNDKAVKAPYNYGIVVIDYVNKMLLNENNYDALLRANSFDIYSQYLKALIGDFTARLKNNEEIKVFNLKDSLFYEDYACHYISHALKNQAIVRYNDKLLKHNGTIESVVGSIYNLPLEGASKDVQIRLLEDYENRDEVNNSPYISRMEKFNDVSFDYPQWEIFQRLGTSGTEEIFEYMKNHGFNFPTYELDQWKSYIKKEQNKQ